MYGDLVSCARYRIDDELEKVERCSPTHVLLMIHLPHQSADACTSTSLSFVGFPGGAWISAHIDGIMISYESDLTLEDAQSTPISHLFYSEMFHNETDVFDTNVTVLLQQEKDEVQNNNYYLTYFHPHTYRWMMIVLYQLLLVPQKAPRSITFSAQNYIVAYKQQ